MLSWIETEYRCEYLDYRLPANSTDISYVKSKVDSKNLKVEDVSLFEQTFFGKMYPGSHEFEITK